MAGRRQERLPRVAVIGTINSDTIITPARRRIRAFGGILYNIRALTQLSGPELEILPVTNLGRDLAKPLFKELAKFEARLDAVRVVDRPHNRCILRYHTAAERSETLTGGVGAVSWDQLEEALTADLILINFISGYDLSWHNLQRLRAQYRGPIYLDFHSRSLALSRNGNRYLRRPPRWQEYLHCADYLQLNEVEYELLAGEKAARKGCADFAGGHLRPGAVMLVTLGEGGCLVVTAEKGEYRATRLHRLTPATVEQTTGCGDVFAAGFIAAQLHRASPVVSARLGIQAAALAAACAIPEQLDLTSLRF